MSDTKETLVDVVADLRERAEIHGRLKSMMWNASEIEAELTEYADRIEAAVDREREELVQSVEELLDGMCPHCDMQQLCAEGEDGMPTTCNAMAKVNAFVARYKQRQPNDGIPF